MKSESLRDSSIGILSTFRSYHWAVSVVLLLPVSSLLPDWPHPLTAKFSTVLENTALGEATRDSPGGPEVKAPRFQFRGRRFNPWSGSKITRATLCGQKKKKNEKKQLMHLLPAILSTPFALVTDCLFIDSSRVKSK